MNLSIVPGGVAALETAIAELVGSPPAGFESLERSAKARRWARWGASSSACTRSG